MPVLLAVLKIAAILVLAIVVLLVAAMLMPLGFAVEYRPGRIRVSAVYGPLRRTVWSRRAQRKAIRKKDNQPATGTTLSTEQQPLSAPVPPAAQAEERRRSPKPPQAPEGHSTPPASSVPLPPEPEEEQEVSSGAVVGRLERILELLTEDPKALATCVLGHLRWLQRHSWFKIQIRHLDVFWTVTGEDAAHTAIVYGAEMAALNTLLALVQQMIAIQSDRLWLEPDFTGTQRAERRISCTVSARAILMFHLLYRIWKDPLLQPVSQR